MNKKKHLIIIAGPTAIGKTAMAISLAIKYKTEIISADSRQFFKEMSIGTAKPTEEELSEVKHHFINSHSIHELYNVGKFESEAIQLLDELFKTKNVVIMVGGSGLYIDAVCKGFDELPDADPLIREKIEQIYEEKGIEELQQMLKELDPIYFAKVDIQNPQRLSRALEVCLTSGKTYTELRQGKEKKRDFNIIKIGLNTTREKLYERINDRVDQMMEAGLLGEVRALEEYKHLNALQTVGYKELFDYIENQTALDAAVELIKQNTRRFAKRQLTWFRKDEEIQWFEPTEEEKIVAYINDKLK